MTVGEDSVRAVTLLVEAVVSALLLVVGITQLNTVVGVVRLGLGLGGWLIIRILDAGTIIRTLETLAAGMEATILGIGAALEGLLAFLMALAVIGVIRVHRLAVVGIA